MEHGPYVAGIEMKFAVARSEQAPDVGVFNHYAFRLAGRAAGIKPESEMISMRVGMAISSQWCICEQIIKSGSAGSMLAGDEQGHVAAGLGQRLLHDRQAGRARARFSLVAPLAASAATDMRITDTAQLDLFSLGASGAVSPPSDRQGDVDSSNTRRTPATTPSSRTLRTATRTGTTRTTSTGFVLSVGFNLNS